MGNSQGKMASTGCGYGARPHVPPSAFRQSIITDADIADPAFDDVTTLPFCVSCDRYFASNSEYEKHEQNDHNSQTRRISVGIFNEASSSLNVFQTPTEIAVSSSSYQTSRRLTKNAPINNRGEGSEYCFACNKAFASNDALEDHMQNNIPHRISVDDFHSVGFRPYECRACGIAYPSKFALQGHNAFVHQTASIVSPRSWSPPPVFDVPTDLYFCAHCDSCFGTPDDYAAHFDVCDANTDDPPNTNTSATVALEHVYFEEKEQEDDLNAEGQTNKRGVECPLCLEEKTHLSSVKCGHVFCTACINGAVETDPRCPICRQGVERSDIRRIFLGAT